MLYVVKVTRENIQNKRREKVRPRDEPPRMKHGSCRICKEKFLPGDNLLTMDKELDQLVRIRCGCLSQGMHHKWSPLFTLLPPVLLSVSERVSEALDCPPLMGWY